jgi:2-iminobutanoate/2-iminopropanoate deaminase
MSCSCIEKRIYTSEKAPKAIGPYSPAVKAGRMVFISGQLGIDPATGNIVSIT